MAQSRSRILIHLIFSTKGRECWLNDQIRPELHAYLRVIFDDLDSPIIKINSVEDHIHVLFQLSKSCALSKVVEKAKTSSSKWIKTKDPLLQGFYWQGGYGAFSVSESNLEQVEQYIVGQKEHHQHKSFQDDFVPFLINIISHLMSNMCGIKAAPSGLHYLDDSIPRALPWAKEMRRAAAKRSSSPFAKVRDLNSATVNSREITSIYPTLNTVGSLRHVEDLTSMTLFLFKSGAPSPS